MTMLFECHLQYGTHPDGKYWVKVTRADPVACITPEILEYIAAGKAGPWMHLDGDVLTIDADNRKVIYRIGEYDPVARNYRMEWPD